MINQQERCDLPHPLRELLEHSNDVHIAISNTRTKSAEQSFHILTWMPRSILWAATTGKLASKHGLAASGLLHSAVRFLMDSWEAEVLRSTSALRTAYTSLYSVHFRGCKHLLHIVAYAKARKSFSFTCTATCRYVSSSSLLESCRQ